MALEPVTARVRGSLRLLPHGTRIRTLNKYEQALRRCSLDLLCRAPRTNAALEVLDGAEVQNNLETRASEQ